MIGPDDDFARMTDAGNETQWTATNEFAVIGRDLPRLDELPRLTDNRGRGSFSRRLGRYLHVNGVDYQRHRVYVLAEATHAAVYEAAHCLIDWVRERYPHHRFVDVGCTPQYLIRRGDETNRVSLRRPQKWTEPPTPPDHTKPPHVMLGGYFFAIPLGSK